MATPYNLAGARRAIHAECRARGMDEAARRQLIREVGRVVSGSTRDLGETAAKRVLDHLRRTGAPADRMRSQAASEWGEWAFIAQAAEANRPLLRKIAAVCGALGIAKGGQKPYAEGVARRQHGIERRLEMMSQPELWQLAGALERTRKFKAKGAPPPEGGIPQPGNSPQS